MGKHTDSLEQNIQAKMLKRGRGRVFNAIDFASLGNRAAIDKALSRMCKTGIIKRVQRGLYELSRKHAVFGDLSPNPFAVITAEMRSRGARWQPSGAYAANLLGISEQVPARITILTDGREGKIIVGRTTIELKRTVPGKMLGGRSQAGLAFQALRYLGKRSVRKKTVNHIRNIMRPCEKSKFARMIPKMPVWMQPIAEEIVHEELQ